MSPLREAVLLEMRLRGLSEKTQESYVHACEELARYYWRPLETLVCAQVQAFLDHLITVRKLSWSTINVYFSALRFLYGQILKWPANDFSIPPRGRSGKRPGVLSRNEVKRLIEAPLNLKHRTLLSMTYGSGLRVSEVVKVQAVDVDRGRMMLKVSGKGHKERYTLLAEHTLLLLGEHWRRSRPQSHFFFGHDKSLPMATATAQSIYNQAVKRSGVRRVGGIHTLRHCFASHALEDGRDIFSIKRWMGHSAIATTGGYLHVVPGIGRKVLSPLDAPQDEA
ncbi:MAG: site-specific integrase [Planctomycetes bacterium]|nr:site-specific integrase [Planctomycetota bacterium]